MNVERLVHLKTVLKRAEKAHRGFKMNKWGSFGTHSLRTNKGDDIVLNIRKINKIGKTYHCGFSACAFGWAALDQTFMKEGLYLRTNCYLDGMTVCYKDPTGYTHLGICAATNFFDLSGHQARQIFFPMRYPMADPTIPDVLKRIDDVMEEHS